MTAPMERATTRLLAMEGEFGTEPRNFTQGRRSSVAALCEISLHSLAAVPMRLPRKSHKPSRNRTETIETIDPGVVTHCDAALTGARPNIRASNLTGECVAMANVAAGPAFSAMTRSERGANGIMERRHDTLDGIEILSSLTAEARRRLAARCIWREFNPRQQIVGHQEDSRTVFFLSAGKAHAAVFSESGKRVTFRDINAGEIFGEFAAIDGESQAATVEAVTRCTVATMSAEAFWEVLRAEPTVMADVLKRVTGQVRVLSKKVFELATLAAGKRIQAELLRLAEPSVTAAGNAVLYPAPTDADIAARAGTTRETVNRQLKEMMEAGMIVRRGRTLVIPDVEKVRRLIASPPTDWGQSARDKASALPWRATFARSRPALAPLRDLH
ncbi:MAG: Crp/Fnr family transcriptional regulator [Dongiaceae bacterium]